MPEPFFMRDHYREKAWTKDNFGPVTVPGNCFFVPGDNRDNALDSRFRGFIAAKDMVGVVLR